MPRRRVATPNLLINMSISKHIFFLSALLAFATSAFAQRPVVTAELDSVTILVGGQVGLNVSVQVPSGVDCHLLSLPDTLTSSVEVVSVAGSDTLQKGDAVEFATRYLVTSFDTGLQYVPPVPVLLLPDSSVVSIPEFTLNVVNPFQKIEMDEQSGVAKIFDIVQAFDAPFQWRELLYYWPWALALAVAVGLFFLIRWLRKKYAIGAGKEKKVVAAPAEPCEVTALRNLERIRDEKLWMHNMVKEFYSDLTDTLRRYIARRYGIQAMESTSAQLIDSLAEHLKDCPKEKGMLVKILEQADFAKFAKIEPLPDENASAVADAMDFVNATTQAVRDSAPQASLKPGVEDVQQADKPTDVAISKE